MSDMRLRWLTNLDMDDVLHIERTAFDYPWTEAEFIACLCQRNCIGMVAECDSNIVGFMIYELHNTHIHVLNFAVAWDCRRQGIGRFMAAGLLGKLSRQDRTHVSLAVRESNLPAQKFFRKVGFKATQIVPDFYPDHYEEAAYIMEAAIK